MPAVHHQLVLAPILAPAVARLRRRFCRKPLLRSPPASGRYTLPAGALAQLQGDATGARNAQKAVILATHVARYQSAPANLGRSFPLDRRALAQPCDLPLSEGEIRGALKLLEEVGFVVRVPAPGSPYQRTVEGLRRKPIWFTLGEPYLAMFAEANRKPRGGPQAAQGGRRPLPASPLPATRPRPSWSPPEQRTNSPKNTPQNPTFVNLGELAKRHSRTNLPLPESRRDSWLSPLEAAIATLGRNMAEAAEKKTRGLG